MRYQNQRATATIVVVAVAFLLSRWMIRVIRRLTHLIIESLNIGTRNLTTLQMNQ